MRCKAYMIIFGINSFLGLLRPVGCAEVCVGAVSLVHFLLQGAANQTSKKSLIYKTYTDVQQQTFA